MAHALDHSLEQLQRRLLRARASLRHARRKADTKRQLLLNSGNVLEYELQDAFSTVTMPRRKQPRILPPPGLVPLINAPGAESHDRATAPAQDNTQECFRIHSCAACIRGAAQDRVWLRLVVENTSSVVVRHAHIVVGPEPLLPQQLARNTLRSIAPGRIASLYAAFTLPSDVFDPQLAALTAACRYATADTFGSTDYSQVHWDLGIDWTQTPAIPDQALSIFYPSHSRAVVAAPDYDRICSLLSMRRAQNTDLLYTDSEDLVIAAADRSLNIYGLTDRLVARCVTALADLVDGMKYAPLKPAATAAEALSSLKIQLGVAHTDGDPRKAQGVAGARESTAALLAALLQARGDR